MLYDHAYHYSSHPSLEWLYVFSSFPPPTLPPPPRSALLRPPPPQRLLPLMSNPFDFLHLPANHYNIFLLCHAYYLIRYWKNYIRNIFRQLILLGFFGFISLLFFLINFVCVFSRSSALLTTYQEWFVWLAWHKKEVHWLDIGCTMWSRPLNSPMTLFFYCSMSNFEIAVFQEWLVW